MWEFAGEIFDEKIVKREYNRINKRRGKKKRVKRCERGGEKRKDNRESGEEKRRQSEGKERKDADLKVGERSRESECWGGKNLERQRMKNETDFEERR